MYMLSLSMRCLKAVQSGFLCTTIATTRAVTYALPIALTKIHSTSMNISPSVNFLFPPLPSSVTSRTTGG